MFYSPWLLVIAAVEIASVSAELSAVTNTIPPLDTASTVSLNQHAHRSDDAHGFSHTHNHHHALKHLLLRSPDDVSKASPEPSDSHTTLQVTVTSTALPTLTSTCTIISTIATGTMIPQVHEHNRSSGIYNLSISKGIDLCPYISYDIALTIFYSNQTLARAGKGSVRPLYGNITGNSSAWLDGVKVKSSGRNLRSKTAALSDVTRFTTKLDSVRSNGSMLSVRFQAAGGAAYMGNVSMVATRLLLIPRKMKAKEHRGLLQREEERVAEGEIDSVHGREADWSEEDVPQDPEERTIVGEGVRVDVF